MHYEYRVFLPTVAEKFHEWSSESLGLEHRTDVYIILPDLNTKLNEAKESEMEWSPLWNKKIDFSIYNKNIHSICNIKLRFGSKLEIKMRGAKDTSNVETWTKVVAEECKIDSYEQIIPAVKSYLASTLKSGNNFAKEILLSFQLFPTIYIAKVEKYRKTTTAKKSIDIEEARMKIDFFTCTSTQQEDSTSYQITPIQHEPMYYQSFAVEGFSIKSAQYLMAQFQSPQTNQPLQDATIIASYSEFLYNLVLKQFSPTKY